MVLGIAGTDLAQHLDAAPRRFLLLAPGAFDEEDEGCGAAIHDRHFRPIDIDDDIVDLGAGERRHEMLDGADRRPLAIAERRAQRRIDDVFPACDDLDPATELIGPAKENAAIRRCRMQRDRRLYPGMEADAATMDRISDCALLHYIHSLTFASLSQAQPGRIR